MRIESRVRNFARHHISLVLLDLIFQGANPKNRVVQRDRTDICIEGYPRSANTWTVYMFEQANQALHIGHHTHAIANIARALRFGIPTIILIRNPIDAITSAVIAQNRGDIDGEISYYLAFYSWVELRADALIVAEFEEVISDLNCVIRRVNEKCGTSFNCIAHLEEAAGRTRQFIRNDVHSRGMNALRWEAIPHVEREELKKKTRPQVSNHRRINEAQALYARIIGCLHYDMRR